MIEPETYASQELGEAERLALVSAPASLKRPWGAVLAFDAQLARIALHAREPALAQLKLAWWRDACGDPAPRRGQPVLQGLAQSWRGDGTVLRDLVDAWESVAAGEGAFAERAGLLAGARARVLAAGVAIDDDPAIVAASRCWTLAMLAANAPDPNTREAMLEAARTFSGARLPRSLRPLAVLAGLARRSARRGGGALLGDRLSPLAALRLGILGR